MASLPSAAFQAAGVNHETRGREIVTKKQLKKGKYEIGKELNKYSSKYKLSI